MIEINNEILGSVYTRGNVDILNQRSVGFSGSRKVTNVGLDATIECATLLAISGVCVVSGGATGVDIAAHRAALQNEGTTVVFICEGIDRYRMPHALREVWDDSRGVIVSQFDLGALWTGSHAFARNVSIIRQSSCVIIPEAAASGGTMNTGREALRRKSRLFVMDFGDKSRGIATRQGNIALIKAGASPLKVGDDNSPCLDGVFQSFER